MARRFAIATAAAATCAVAATGRPLPGEPDLPAYSFEQYTKDLDKKYTSEEEAEERRDAFEHNLALARMHNARPDKTWFAAANEFMDWGLEEFRSRRTSRLPTPPEEFMFHEILSEAKLPDSVDWRNRKGVVTPPKNQGGCGSCWAFSATETLESHLALATGEDAPVLSPQQIVSCSPNPRHCGGTGGCAGSTAQLGFNYTTTAGITLESDYPYKGVTGTCQPTKINAVAKNQGFVNLAVNDYDSLLTAVATKGPISISVAAGSAGWQLYGGGVYSGGVMGCGFEVDHAVQLVGYGAEGSELYWIVRNSWGANWGEQGYIRIKRFGSGKEPCGEDKHPLDGVACEGDTKPKRYCGLCAILSSSSYPTGMQKLGFGQAGIVV